MTLTGPSGVVMVSSTGAAVVFSRTATVPDISTPVRPTSAAFPLASKASPEGDIRNAPSTSVTLTPVSVGVPTPAPSVPVRFLTAPFNAVPPPAIVPRSKVKLPARLIMPSKAAVALPATRRKFR